MDQELSGKFVEEVLEQQMNLDFRLRGRLPIREKYQCMRKPGCDIRVSDPTGSPAG
jgi:hypothetical protein